LRLLIKTDTFIKGVSVKAGDVVEVDKVDAQTLTHYGLAAQADMLALGSHSDKPETVKEEKKAFIKKRRK